VALTDALGNMVRFELLPGQRFDTVGVAPLIKDIDFGGLIADKAFDSAWILEELDARGAQVVISPHPRRIERRGIDAEIYKWRHLIENFFGKLKEFKRIALRACKTDASFAAMIYAAAAFLNSR
jgi:transposase